MPESTPEQNPIAAAARLNRRALLRGASTALPAILTLQSGAALARSSNLIGAAGQTGPQGGKYRCLDFDGIGGTDSPNVYDLGDPAMAHVTRIDSESRYYRENPDERRYGEPDRVSPQRMCQQGGDFYRRDNRRTRRVQVKQGVLVSATALSSFSSGIRYTDV